MNIGKISTFNFYHHITTTYYETGVEAYNLNDCITYSKMLNGNWDQINYTGTPLIEGNFEGDLVLVCQYSQEESGEIFESYDLYTTPNFTILRENADKEDESRWLDSFGLSPRAAWGRDNSRR